MHREKILSRSCAYLRNPFSLMARKGATTKIAYLRNLTRSVGLKSLCHLLARFNIIQKTKVVHACLPQIEFDGDGTALSLLYLKLKRFIQYHP